MRNSSKYAAKRTGSSAHQVISQIEFFRQAQNICNDLGIIKVNRSPRTVSVTIDQVKRQVKAQLIMNRDAYITDGKVDHSKMWLPIRELLGCVGERWENKTYDIDILMTSPMIYKVCAELGIS